MFNKSSCVDHVYLRVGIYEYIDLITHTASSSLKRTDTEGWLPGPFSLIKRGTFFLAENIRTVTFGIRKVSNGDY